MKKIGLIIGFVLIGISGYCSGGWKNSLVNKQSIDLKNITTINVSYCVEEITLVRSNTNSLVIREFMSRDNSLYFAKITQSEDNLSIERGDRPSGLFNTFRARVEIQIPVSLSQKIIIQTTSGKIIVSDNIICSHLILRTSNGNISINRLTADTVNIISTGGNVSINALTIDFGNIRTTNGRIHLNNINIAGLFTINSTSGKIHLSNLKGYTFDRTMTDFTRSRIHVTTISGNIELFTPPSPIFSFDARTSSGRLSVPIPVYKSRAEVDRLLRHGMMFGTTGMGRANLMIVLRSESGAIKIELTN